MTPIALHFESDFDEYLHGMRLYDSKELMSGQTLVRFVVSGVVCGAAFVFLFGGWPYFLLGVLPMALGRISIYFARKPQARAIYKSKIAQGQFDVTFDESGMVSQSTNGKTELGWHAFEKIIESDRVFLLVYSKYGYVTIPKRAFASKEQIDEFRALATSKIVPSAAR